MHRKQRWFIASASLALLSACENGTQLSSDVTLSSTPTQLPFTAPVTARDSARAVCLSFNPPGGSRRAAEVQVVLVTAENLRDTLRTRVDRTGESTVCLRDTAAVASTRTYTRIEFTVPTTLNVERIHWVVAR